MEWTEMVRYQQQDLHDAWEAMCFAILKIMGSDATRTALENGQIEVKFFEPKSLIIQNIIDDINNVKNLAENIADIIPEFNAEDSEQKRSNFIYRVVKTRTNLDFGEFEDILREVNITSIDDSLKTEIAKLIREYMENTKEVQYGDANSDGLADGMSGSEISAEDQEILNTPGEEDDTDEEMY